MLDDEATVKTFKKRDGHIWLMPHNPNYEPILGDDAVIVADPGTPCPYFSAFYPKHRAGRWFITNRAHGALGYSLPGAVGAWYGRPSSKVVAFTQVTPAKSQPAAVV